MIKNVIKSVFYVLVGLGLASCAKEEVDSDKTKQERVLNAYISEYYPSAKKESSGLTILENKEGSGDQVVNLRYVYADYSTKRLDGTYLTTNDVELSKKLGSYSKSKYYGPKLFEVGNSSTYAGLEELFLKMRVGGEATAIIPPWLSYTYSKKNWNESSNIIYNIKVKNVIEDIIKFQLDSMKSYANIYYPGLDTISNGFYFKKLHDAKADTLKSENVSVYYVGKLLDGYVFDTNIADSAKMYGIYNPSNKYEPISANVSDDLSSVEESSKLVKGFCMALQKMSYGDKAFTMFASPLGYQGNTQGEIGPYQPLIFWIYIAPKQ